MALNRRQHQGAGMSGPDGRATRRAVVHWLATGLLATAAPATAGCAPPWGSVGGSASGSSQSSIGRLTSRPSAPPSLPSLPAGLSPLGLAEGRDGLLFIPSRLDPSRPVPLALVLHGGNGNPRPTLASLMPLAEERTIALLAPESRGRTWDLVLDAFGPDIPFIDRALMLTFERLRVDPTHLAVAGVSDGGSYALSLGVTNGDLFSHIAAFVPGFAAPAERRGRPALFVASGRRDEIFPIDTVGRPLAEQLRREGLAPRVREFDGGHRLVPEVAAEALDWFLGR